mgnify:FL=1|tara:strand:- start:190 stop:384 length:195 start_codon:yes stop_codon:yes gene_type:complete
MKLTKDILRKIIIEEMNKSQKEIIKEGTEENPVNMTPDMLNKIIREEYSAHQRRQKLLESFNIK